MYLHSYFLSAFLYQNFTKFFTKAIVKFFSRGINKYLKIISCFSFNWHNSSLVCSWNSYLYLLSRNTILMTKDICIWDRQYYCGLGWWCVLSASRSRSVNQTKRKFGQLVFVNFQQTLFLFDLWIFKVCPSFSLASRNELLCPI